MSLLMRAPRAGASRFWTSGFHVLGTGEWSDADGARHREERLVELTVSAEPLGRSASRPMSPCSTTSGARSTSGDLRTRRCTGTTPRAWLPR